MDNDDNIELILNPMLSTHEQQLQTLRERRHSLLKIARFNIILLSILIALVGFAAQGQLPVGPIELSIPIVLVIFSIVMAMLKYKYFSEHWGFGLNREFIAEMNSLSRDSALQEIAGIYQTASEQNRTEIRAIEKWILGTSLLMCISLGSLLALIVFSV